MKRPSIFLPVLLCFSFFLSSLKAQHSPDFLENQPEMGDFSSINKASLRANLVFSQIPKSDVFNKWEEAKAPMALIETQAKNQPKIQERGGSCLPDSMLNFWTPLNGDTIFQFKQVYQYDNGRKISTDFYTLNGLENHSEWTWTASGDLESSKYISFTPTGDFQYAISYSYYRNSAGRLDSSRYWTYPNSLWTMPNYTAKQTYIYTPFDSIATEIYQGNYMNEPEVLTGKSEFAYNSQRKLEKEVFLFWDAGVWDTFSLRLFDYNQDNIIEKQTAFGPVSSSSALDTISKILYEYPTPQEEVQHHFETFTGVLEERFRDIFYYDIEGKIQQRYTVFNPNILAVNYRSDYIYDNQNCLKTYRNYLKPPSGQQDWRLNAIERYYYPNSTPINEIKADAPFVLYPNPSQGSLQIDLSSQAKQVSIFDSSGKLIRNITPEQSEYFLKIDALVAGFYVVMVETEQGRFVEKLVVR